MTLRGKGLRQRMTNVTLESTFLEYKLVRNTRDEVFEIKVNEQLTKGWRLYGQAFAFGNVLCQPMVREVTRVSGINSGSDVQSDDVVGSDGGTDCNCVGRQSDLLADVKV